MGSPKPHLSRRGFLQRATLTAAVHVPRAHLRVCRAGLVGVLQRQSVMNATAAKEMPTRLVAVISAVAPPFSGSMRSTMIAFGIGVHNFGEGLAIGSAYAAGEIALGAWIHHPQHDRGSRNRRARRTPIVASHGRGQKVFRTEWRR
jgi:zinc transporter ZupT